MNDKHLTTLHPRKFIEIREREGEAEGGGGRKRMEKLECVLKPQTKTILYKVCATRGGVRRDLRGNGIAATEAAKEAAADRGCVLCASMCLCTCVRACE